MITIRLFLKFCLPGIVALWLSAAPAFALPLFAPLLTPAPLHVLLSPAVSALTAAPLPPAPPALPGSAVLPPPGGSLWDSALDPSLRLTDWRHVFDIAALGSFEIPLRDDPAERANILLSAQAVDQAVIAPGAEFSFNTHVGERTPERGYQDGWMFDSGQLVRGTGGGICLVATGLYNAALQAGLQIMERHPHSGVVGYAPPGCDAGIVYGLEDLRFRNTTGRPLVIRAIAEDTHLTMQIFGLAPPPGLAVTVRAAALETIPPPVITRPDPALPPGGCVVAQKPRSGYRVVVERVWTQGPRVVRREIVTRESRDPRPEILRVAVPVPAVTPLPGAIVSGPISSEPGSPGPLMTPLPLSGTPAAPLSPPTDAEPGD